MLVKADDCEDTTILRETSEKEILGVSCVDKLCCDDWEGGLIHSQNCKK